MGPKYFGEPEETYNLNGMCVCVRLISHTVSEVCSVLILLALMSTR